jgi:hypothetical protein
VTNISGCAFAGCSRLTSIYIPSSVTTISAFIYEESPFYNCSSSLKIYCGASEAPSGWGTYWNYYDSSNTLDVTWGVTRTEYEALIASGAAFSGDGTAVSELVGLSDSNSGNLSENIIYRTNVLYAQNVAICSASGASYDVSVAQIEEPTDTVTAYIEQEKKYLMGAVLNKKLFGNDDKIE